MIQTFKHGHAVELADKILAYLYRLTGLGISHLSDPFSR